MPITKLDEELQNSDLWHNVELRRSVLEDALPHLMLQKIGLDKIIERVSCFLKLINRMVNLCFRCLIRTYELSLVVSWPADSCTSMVQTQANSLSLICKSIIILRLQANPPSMSKRLARMNGATHNLPIRQKQ